MKTADSKRSKISIKISKDGHSFSLKWRRFNMERKKKKEGEVRTPRQNIRVCDISNKKNVPVLEVKRGGKMDYMTFGEFVSSVFGENAVCLIFLPDRKCSD